MCVCVVLIVELTELTSYVRRFTKFSFMYFAAKNNRRDNTALRILYIRVTEILGIRRANVR